MVTEKQQEKGYGYHMKEKNFGQNLFEMAFLVLAVKNVLDSSSLINRPDVIDNLLILTFMGFIVWKLLLQTYTWWRLLFFGALGMLCTYTCIKGDYFYLFFTYIGTISMQNVELKSVMKKTSILKIILILIHVIAYLLCLGFTPESIQLVERNGVLRHAVFMGHPNTFSMYVLWTTMEFLYAHYEKLRIPSFLLLLLCNYFTYIFTDSNTSMIVSTVVIGLLIPYKASKEKWSMKFVHPVSKYGFLFCSIVFPLMVAVYPMLSGVAKNFFEILNEALTGRLLYGAYAYDAYGFSLIGRSIGFPAKSYWRGYWLDTIIFDNSYIWMFILYGCIYLAIISVTFIWMSKRTTNIEKILVIGLTFYGIMEAYIVNASICFPLFFIGKYMYQVFDERREKKEKRYSRRIHNG